MAAKKTRKTIQKRANGKTLVSKGAATLLANGDTLEGIVRPEQGLVSRRIFADPEIHQMEIDRIFGRCWFFLGHESEIPKPGDFVTRPCGLDPVILIRSDDGIIRAFLNSCRHRGMRVCRTDRDNTHFLRCPYHGWSYRNNGELAAVGAEQHYGPGELEKDRLGLIEVAKLSSYRGLIFATWDEHAPPLEKWLGNVKWYLDIICGRTGEIEFISVPQIWEVECAWKIATDNFTDNFHVFHTHQSLVELGLLPNMPDFASFGHMVTAGNGHVLHFVHGEPNNEAFMGMGLPKELWPQFEKYLNPAQREIAMAHAYSAGTVWPNFHWLQLVSSSDIGGKSVGILNFRLEIPLTPTRTRMYSWVAIDKGASKAYRDASYETYVRTFGPGGIFDQDDMENWEDCTVTAVGPTAKRYTLHHKMGLKRKQATDWPGPGIAYPDSYGEMTQRAWYAEWLRWMQRPLNGTNRAVRP